MQKALSKRSQKSIPSLKRENSSYSEDALRGSSVAGRVNTNSERRTLLVTKNKSYTRSLTKNLVKIPYQNFVRQMRIKLPTPKEKFYQFLRIPPFNRVQNHNELIRFFLKNIKFFKLHQNVLIDSMAKKVRLVEVHELEQKMMVVVLEGECCYMGNVYSSGQLINRQALRLAEVSADANCKLVAISGHQYRSFLSGFIREQILQFKDFINGIQTFKIFSDRTLQKFSQNLTLHYYLKGEKLFRVGDEANFLFVVYSGKVSRKVIIEIEKVNKIPTHKFQRLVRILNKSYLHQIQFFREDMVGVSEIIDNVSIRKEEIDVDQDSILLGIPRNIIEENMDDYIVDRLKKYNLKKYPANYDDLCQNYLKAKNQLRKTEERKIIALQNELKNHQTNKKREKIESIIRFYEQNVKGGDNKNLINRKLHFQIDRHS